MIHLMDLETFFKSTTGNLISVLSSAPASQPKSSLKKTSCHNFQSSRNDACPAKGGKKCILALIDIILAVKQKSDNLVGFQACASAIDF